MERVEIERLIGWPDPFPWRSKYAIRRLAHVVDRLTEAMQFPVYVTGGAVARAYLGVWLPGKDHLHDIDIVMPQDRFEDVEAAATALTQACPLVRRDTRTYTSSAGKTREVPGLFFGEQRLDIILARHPADLIARYDIRCCAIALGAPESFAYPGAIDDLRERRLIINRPTLPWRIAKYLAHGLNAPGIPDVDGVLTADDSVPHIIDATLAHDRTRRLRWDLELEVVIRGGDEGSGAATRSLPTPTRPRFVDNDIEYLRRIERSRYKQAVQAMR